MRLLHTGIRERATKEKTFLSKGKRLNNSEKMVRVLVAKAQMQADIDPLTFSAHLETPALVVVSHRDSTPKSFS